MAGDLRLCVHSDKQTGRLALVFELMDMNIYELIRGRKHPVNAQVFALRPFHFHFHLRVSHPPHSGAVGQELHVSAAQSGGAYAQERHLSSVPMPLCFLPCSV